VSSAISRIVVKSDQAFRKIPTLGEVVGVVGKSGLFVVMKVDLQDREAQLMEKGGKHRLTNVPFSAIRTINRKLAQTIKRFLDTREESREDR
jgi:hypothetical protein